MKNTHSKVLIAFATSMALGACLAWASSSPQVSAARKALKGVPAVELPAKAAAMVAQAKPEDRDTAAAAVVTAALGVRPTSTMAVVSAIARQTPSAAPTAAAKAAFLQPKKLADIAAAAASAAPKQAASIVEAMCKAMPAQYAVIATAVAKAVPTACQEIVAAVTAAIPSLKPFVDKAASEYAGMNPSVSLLMTRTDMWVTASANASSTPPVLAPPLPGPPYTPIPPSGIIVTRSGPNTIPGGGHDYSSP
jgi:hypothetical protein